MATSAAAFRVFTRFLIGMDRFGIPYLKKYLTVVFDKFEDSFGEN